MSYAPGIASGTMAKDWSKELQRCTFRCTVCRHTWEAEPTRVEPDEAAPHHPFRYLATCPACDAREQPQAPWERALLKAHQMSTGPTTPAGLAATTANLAGHPTPEEALRTRFNAMRHGLSARTATYFPAKPDGYAFCQRCDVDRGWCGEQAACVKQTELFMLHHAAFEQRNPKVLARVHADIHAALVASLQMCLQAVLGHGVVMAVPKVQLDKDGRSVTLTYVDKDGQQHQVMEYMANPAFKPIADLVTRLGLSLGDLGMTAKAQDDDDAELRGRLGATTGQNEALDAFARRMADALERVPAMLQASRADAERDPVLVEHNAATGGAPGAVQ
jgi:hypothetical protein